MPNITVPLEIAGDALSSSTQILSPGTLSADNVIVRIPLSTSYNLTAIVTGISFRDEKSGAPVFTGGAAGQVFTPINDVSFPQVIKITGGTTSSAITISLSALGQPCASGLQSLNYIISLSSEALSGAGNGIRATVTNTTDTSLSTTVTATNTPFAGRTCEAEYRRLRYMEAC